MIGYDQIEIEATDTLNPTFKALFYYWIALAISYSFSVSEKKNCNSND